MSVNISKSLIPAVEDSLVHLLIARPGLNDHLLSEYLVKQTEEAMLCHRLIGGKMENRRLTSEFVKMTALNYG